jgi:hypothetical protein
MKIFKAFFAIPENTNDMNLFYLVNLIIFIIIELLFIYLNSSIVTSYKGNTYSSFWNLWAILVVILLFWLLIKKRYQAIVECFFLILFFLNRAILLKIFLHAIFLLLEVFILSKVIDNYISGGGFEKTSLIIYALGQLYLYTQIAFMLKKKIFISTLKKNI